MNVLSSGISSYYSPAQDYASRNANTSATDSSGNNDFYENLRAHLSEQKQAERKQPAKDAETDSKRDVKAPQATTNAVATKTTSSTPAKTSQTPDNDKGEDSQTSTGQQSKQSKQDPNAKSSKENALDARRLANDEADSVALSLDATTAITVDQGVAKQASDDTTQSVTAASAKSVSPADDAEATQPTPAAQPILGDLAFALKIQSARATNEDDSDETAPPAVQTNSSNALLSLGAQVAPQVASHKDDAQVAAIVAPEAVDGHKASSTNSQADDSANSTQQTSNTNTDFEAELNKFRAAEPVRGAHVQITGADSQKVDIRLVERAGSLSVTVRSADSNLTRSLQDHAQELNTNLHLEHFHSELWTPSTARSSFQQQSNGEQSNPSNSNNGGGNSQQQNRKQQQQPDWMDEMESQSKTLSNRINYTWQ